MMQSKAFWVLSVCVCVPVCVCTCAGMCTSQTQKCTDVAEHHKRSFYLGWAAVHLVLYAVDISSSFCCALVQSGVYLIYKQLHNIHA